MKKSASAKKSKTKAKKSGRRKVPAFYAISKRLGYRLLDSGDQALYSELFTDERTMAYFRKPLSPEEAVQSFRKAVAVTKVLPVKQRITVISDRRTGKPLGIASLKLADAHERRAEGGLILKPGPKNKSLGLEGSRALIDEAFKRHTIAELRTHIPVAHKNGERLAAESGYRRISTLAGNDTYPERSEWSICRDTWADNVK
jgi:RimJ/RimL family protein N-acetyltransferase